MRNLVLPKQAPMGGLSEAPAWREPTRIFFLSNAQGQRVARIEIEASGVNDGVFSCMDELLRAVVEARRR